MGLTAKINYCMIVMCRQGTRSYTGVFCRSLVFLSTHYLFQFYWLRTGAVVF